MRFLYYFFGICFLVSCVSCSKVQYQSLFEQAGKFSDTTANAITTAHVEYRIKSQDILQVKNLQNVQYIVDQAPINNGMSGGSTTGAQTYQVEEDGTVALPVIGHVAVVGLTRSEAQKTIEDLYKKTLLKDPIIELKIVNLKITILGEIKSQGNYPLVKDQTSLVEMIGEAGGITGHADEKHIEIIRGTQKNPKVTIINLNSIQSINDADAILQSGDIVYIPQNKRAIRNDQLTNFSTLVQPALLLFNTALIIFTLAHR